MENISSVFTAFPKGYQRAIKAAHRHWFTAEETAEERAYLAYLLLVEKLTPLQVHQRIETPLAYVNLFSKQFEKRDVSRVKVLEPPPGFKSKIANLWNDAELAAYAKWFLKHQVSPRELAKMLGVTEVWVYSLISGRIHFNIRARDPNEPRREVTIGLNRVKPARVEKEDDPKRVEAREKREKEHLEACYLLFLYRSYSLTVLSKVSGRSYLSVRNIVQGVTHKDAAPKQPPEGYWNLPEPVKLVKQLEKPRSEMSERRKKNLEEACYILYLLQDHSMKEVSKITGRKYQDIWNIKNGRIGKSATPKEPPEGYWNERSLQVN